MRIRSVTVFGEVTPTGCETALDALGAFAGEARSAFQGAGYDVQTVRLALNQSPARTAPAWKGRLADWASTLELAAAARGFDYVSLGPQSVPILPEVPEMLAATEGIFASAHIVDPRTGAIDGETIRACAQVIREAAQVAEGFGNLRFAALALVPPNTPFFPGSFGAGPGSAFAIATEAADLAVLACRDAGTAQDAHDRLRVAVEREAARMVRVADQLAADHKLAFEGIDFSLAPFPERERSIGEALELLSGGPVGCAGTLAAAATLTDAIDRAQFPHAGYSGLMLPVLEDAVLARRSAEQRYSVGDLLQWSAVCGTGLDTVPIPGDTSSVAIEGLLYDVAALAVRLAKPLTARLMPLPGKRAGDLVHFDFDYFADGGVLAVPEGLGAGLVHSTSMLVLGAKRRWP